MIAYPTSQLFFGETVPCHVPCFLERPMPPSCVAVVQLVDFLGCLAQGN